MCDDIKLSSASYSQLESCATENCKQAISMTGSVYLCDTFIIKLTYGSDMEYKNYLKLYNNPNTRQLIYKMPMFYEDDDGSAIVFDNTDKVTTVKDQLLTMSIDQIRYVIKKILLALQQLHDNGYAHTDSHVGNILYKDDRVYFIDIADLEHYNDDSYSIEYYTRVLHMNDKDLHHWVLESSGSEQVQQPEPIPFS